MATGACGIDCTVCRLHVQGVCSTCGAGTSEAGREKLAAQHRLFGAGCPILQCAVDRGIGHCLRDCDDFPCDTFATGSMTGEAYPFADGFLRMQQRRRTQASSPHQAAWPENAAGLWEQLAEADPTKVCAQTGAAHVTEDSAPGVRYQVQSLRETWLVRVDERTVTKVQGEFGGEWDRQLPFLILVYLTHATPPPTAGVMVAPRELYGGLDAFQGKHALHTAELESRFGRELEALPQAAATLGGAPCDGPGAAADVALRLHPLPKLPVDYLLWLADDEFPARLTILLDRHTPQHFPADACAALVNLLTRRLLLSGRGSG